MTDFFEPVEPSPDDIEAYSIGLFPAVLLGNHIQWAINALGIDEKVSRHAMDSFPRHRLYLKRACERVVNEYKEQQDD